MRYAPVLFIVAACASFAIVTGTDSTSRADDLKTPDATASQKDASTAGEKKSAPKADEAEKIDFNRARQYLQKQKEGGKLTAEEQAYLDRARALRRKTGGRPAGTASPQLNDEAARALVPLTDLVGDATYKGQTGGLYGGGKNDPPAAHLQAALEAVKKIQPLDKQGHPAPEGKIVLISNGMSNTTQEFQPFVRLANADADKSPALLIVDCAQGGQEAFDWAQPENRFRGDRPNPWDEASRRLDRAGVSPLQVQVAWIKQARRNPASLGEFPKHAEELKQHLVTIVQKLKAAYPNLQIVYLSSRIYAGNAKSPLNPEPYAYEGAFAVRWLIEDQIKGGVPELNHNPQRGDVKSALLLWGPYLWASGADGRKTDDLVWKPEDFAGDGTHPSSSGQRKVAELLLKFMKSNATAKPWVTKDVE
jgi:lysophospholipase L1-like esterase